MAGLLAPAAEELGEDLVTGDAAGHGSRAEPEEPGGAAQERCGDGADQSLGSTRFTPYLRGRSAKPATVSGVAGGGVSGRWARRPRGSPGACGGRGR